MSNSSQKFKPPLPQHRPDKVNWRKHLKLFKDDLFSSQPKKLYHAKMAEFRLPFFRSFFTNQPDLVDLVLKKRPDDFPKSPLVWGALYSLLGDSVFVTNGALWKKQRRIIDPSFEGGRLRDTFSAMIDAADAALATLEREDLTKPIEIEEYASYFAADIIFRTLFSLPITNDIARETYESFQAYQRTQPLMNIASFLRAPKLMRYFERQDTKDYGAKIRALLLDLTTKRAQAIEAGTAPDDLATKIMTTKDPLTQEQFSPSEMIDQVAIFFLAGHETSASALAWTLYCLANDKEAQEKCAAEIRAIGGTDALNFSDLSKLPFIRDVFRETLRLYPPVPMMIRQSVKRETFRKRRVPRGSQIIISSFHIQRHEALWDDPHLFDPERWSRFETKQSQKRAYLPFSMGPRVCTGAGFAMIEGVLMLAKLLDRFQFDARDTPIPQPVAHLTLRAKEGIYLNISKREK